MLVAHGIRHKPLNQSEKVKAGCPVSKLLNATITLDARLV
jgi:hypothetical protein